MKSDIAEDDDEKQDAEKDVEESDADVLQNDGDIKLEDLEEQTESEDNKEVGFIMKLAITVNTCRYCKAELTDKPHPAI